MTELIGRTYKLAVGTTVLEGSAPKDGTPFGFHVRFVVKRSLKPEPNTLECDVYNLTADSRAALALAKQPIQLDAGYVGGTSTLFIGFVSSTSNRRVDNDIVTKILAGDGAQAMRSAHVSASLPGAQANPVNIVETIAKSLKIANGNIGSALAKFDPLLNAKLAKLGKVGGAFVGPAPLLMNAATRSTGLEWSVQSDKLQVLQRRKAVEGTAIILNESTGLVGVPTVETKGKTAGRVKARALMLPDAFPGRLVKIESEFVSGQYRIENTTHTGDFDGGQDWYVDLEGAPY